MPALASSPRLFAGPPITLQPIAPQWSTFPQLFVNYPNRTIFLVGKQELNLMQNIYVEIESQQESASDTTVVDIQNQCYYRRKSSGPNRQLAIMNTHIFHEIAESRKSPLWFSCF